MRAGFIWGFEMVGKSWLRELMNTTHTPRTGRPFLNVLKMCGAIGSTKTETAAVLQMTIEEMDEAIDGKRTISVRGADRLISYFEILWWWHCYRSGRDRSCRPSDIKAVYLRAAAIWADLPFRLIEDWHEAYDENVDPTMPESLI